MKNSIVMNMTPYSLMTVNLLYKGTYCLHLQGRRCARQAKSKKHAANNLSALFRGICLSSTPATMMMEILRSSETSDNLY
jgi:hypothetical protein